MCGIVGCRQGAGQPASRAQVGEILPLLRHRGPDQDDLVKVADLVVGHTRLSIIDPGGCRQPVVLGQPGDRWVLAFNGEILNFRDLQSGLQLPDGAEHSDTLTLAALLHRDGLGVIRKLRGQFAFVWWSERTGLLSLVRDSLGILPLYYSVSSDGRVNFASEIAALDALVGFTSHVDPHSAAHYLAYRRVDSPRTMFQNARSVSPGETVTFDRTGTCTRSTSLPWFPVAQWTATEAQAFDAVGRALDVAIDRSLVADVPVGLLLSGGLDSNLLLAELRTRSPRDEIYAFTAVGGEKRGEEVRAEQFAQRFGATHHVVRLSPDDFIERAREMSRNRDSPISEPADIFIDAVAECAQRYVKVLLSGEGADEVFGGYTKYRKARIGAPVGSALRALPGSVRRQLPDRLQVLSRVGGATRELEDSSWFASLTAHEISDLGLHLSPPTAPEVRWDRSNYDRVQAMMINDMLTWLPGNLLTRADRCAMRHSVEARPPLLDIDLVRLGLSLPISLRAAGPGKKILRAVAASRHGEDLARQPKQGFPVPTGEWLVGPLSGDVLHSAETIIKWLELSTRARSAAVELVARLPSKAQWAILSLGMWLEERPEVSG